MMDAIKFLKFDLRMIKASSKQYLLIALIPFVIFAFSGDSYIFAISYLLLMLVILAAIPFSMQGNEKSTEMYYMFPAKISSMVLGRFIYLICSALAIFVLVSIDIWYLYQVNVIQGIELIAILLSALVCLIMCFIQYPLYYKLGIQNGRIISLMIYIIPGAIVYALPNIFRKRFDLSANDSVILMLICIIIVAIFGIMSYLVSYKICKNKQL